MCSRKKLVISGAIGVMRPPLRSVLRRRRRCRSSAQALPPDTNTYGRCPCGPCMLPGRRASRHEYAADVRENGQCAPAEESGERCNPPYWRQSADFPPTKTRGHPSRATGGAVRGTDQKLSPPWDAGESVGSYRTWYDESGEPHRAVRHATVGRALQKCGVPLRQATRATFRRLAVEAGTTGEAD